MASHITPSTLVNVKRYLLERGGTDLVKRMQEFDSSSATVELAAQCLGCEPAWIAKTLAFEVKYKDPNATLKSIRAAPHPRGVVLVVAAGDAKVSKDKFKAKFENAPRMLKKDEVYPRVGHFVGGVCPFAIRTWSGFEEIEELPSAAESEENSNASPVSPTSPTTDSVPIAVYLDVSLKRFEKVYPACGSANSGIGITIAEMEDLSNYAEWVDVCDSWE